MIILDIWEEMYLKAKKEYHPEEVSPFIQAHHVVAAVQSESGKIFTGFCIEGASGVINLCAERVAALNMYLNTGETKIKRLRKLYRKSIHKNKFKLKYSKYNFKWKIYSYNQFKRNWIQQIQ